MDLDMLKCLLYSLPLSHRCYLSLSMHFYLISLVCLVFYLSVFYFIFMLSLIYLYYLFHLTTLLCCLPHLSGMFLISSLVYVSYLISQWHLSQLSGISLYYTCLMSLISSLQYMHGNKHTHRKGGAKEMYSYSNIQNASFDIQGKYREREQDMEESLVPHGRAKVP